MRQEKINEIKAIIPLMKSMSDYDLAIGLYDADCTLLEYSTAETFELDFRGNTELKSNIDDLKAAIKTGKKVSSNLPKDKNGNNIKCNFVPVFDGYEVAGCIGSFSNGDDIATIKEKLDNVENFMKVLEDKATDVSNVVNTIKTNSSRTNMLALNASIEAARAGESGRGFSIVASELGKLSQMSTDSTNHIGKTLDELIKSMSDVMKALDVKK